MPGDSPEILERFQSELKLVEALARSIIRTLGPEVELSDLVSFGREGLLEAARRYQPDRGVPFRTFAHYRVHGAIIDGLRGTSRLPRRVYRMIRAYEAATLFNQGAAEDLSSSSGQTIDKGHAERALSEHLAGMATAIAAGFVAEPAFDEGEATGVARDVSPEEQVERAELMHAIGEAIAELPPEEAELVRRHYLEGDRFDEVARELGLSKSWASRLHTRAISRLSKRLRSRL